MQPIEYEHDSGQKELSGEELVKIKKVPLIAAFGKEKFEKLLEDAKSFFESHKENILRGRPLKS